MPAGVEPATIQQVGKRLDEEVSILEIDQHAYAKHDAQQQQTVGKGVVFVPLDADADKIEYHRYHQQQGQHEQVGIGVEEIACQKQHYVLIGAPLLELHVAK